IYTPGGTSWTVNKPMAAARYGHTATRLPSGKVLVIGGANGTTALNSVELYDPSGSGSWSTQTSMKVARQLHTATLLPSGQVLVAGGQDINGVSTDSAELYDPVTNTWSDAGPLNGVRGRHIAALFSCGQVLIAGGAGANGADLASAEIYTQKDNLTPNTLNSGTVGQAFTQNFSLTGGVTPITYTLTGTLPKGMTLQLDGKLTGVPEEKGSFTFTVKATDKNGCMGTVKITWQVECPTIVISPSGSLSGVAGQTYSPLVQLTANGGTASYTYALSSGLLPNGMQLTSDGKLQGTPMEAGNFTFSVTVTDKFGCTGVRVYPLTITCQTIAIGPENMQLRDAMQAMEYNPTLPPGPTFTATGGCGQYSFSVSSGQLPPGMSLSASGSLTGVPTKSGDYEFTIKVTDKCGCMATKVYKLKVTCPFRSLLNQSLFNTGVNDSGVVLADGAKDPHYNVTPPNSSAFVVPEYPGWIKNSDSTASKWISHSADRTSTASSYSYKVAFPLSTCDPNTVVIQGRWAADNNGAIYLNNTIVPSGQITGNGGFKQWQPFTINSGFSAGANTIEFRVNDAGTVSGLRVEFLSAVAKCCGCTPPPRSAALIGWWPLDGDAKEIRSGRDGVITGGAFGAGMVKGGWKSSGQGSVIDVGNAAIFSGPVLTLDAWVRVDGYNALNMPIVGKGNPAGQDTFTPYSLFVAGTSSGISGAVPGQVGVLVSDCVKPQFVLSGTVLPLNSLKHVAATISNTEVKIYIDGVLSGSAALTLTPGAKCTPPFNLQIGGITGAIHDNYFNGLIDELEYWNEALTEDEIRNVYSAFSDGKCKPASPCANVNITLTSQPNPLPVGTAGVAYPNTQFTAAGGTGPYMYTATGLPPGLTLSMDGKLTGTPTMQGTYNIVITVKDANGCTAEFRPRIVINCREFSIKPDFLPAGNVGSPYPKQTFTTDSPCPPVSYTVNGLPPGLIFANGMLTGTPTQTGTFNVAVSVTDACGCPSRKTYTIIIRDCPRVPINVFNTGVDNNKKPLNLGTPDGHYSAASTNGSTAVLTVIQPQSNWVTSPNARWIGKTEPGFNRFSTTFNLSGCDLTSVKIVGKFAANLGAQMFLNGGSTPIVTNNGPTAFTDFNITSGFQAGPNTLTFVVTQGPSVAGLLVDISEAFAKCCECKPLPISPTSLPAANHNQVYPPVTLTSNFGVPPYTYSIIGGALPLGMNLSAAGVLSGTPIVSGGFTFKVLVVDGFGCFGTIDYSLTVRRRQVSLTTNVVQSANLVGPPTTTVMVNVMLSSSGTENRWSFGILPSRPNGLQASPLSNPRAMAGPDAANGQLTVNTSQIAQNTLGLEIAMPTGQTLKEGQQHIFTLMYDLAPNAIGSLVQFQFMDTPVPRAIYDVDGKVLDLEFLNPPVVMARAATSVSAASYRGERLAPEEIVAVFGNGLATSTQVATTLPLPTTLAGTSVKVRDSKGVERPSPLFFVAPTQVNYLLPAGTAEGLATVLITSGDGVVSGSVVEVGNVAPGLFVADASGRGLSAASALLFKADGTQSSQPVARFDTTNSRFVAVPIDLGGESDRVFLSLFGTGLRKRTSLENVRAFIGGIQAPVLFAGEQGGFAGLDQINIEIPRALAGSGLVDLVLIVDDRPANVVQIHIQ
ncbi:MAG TPA: putative Ig domain-containing protein, partial [Blastocatellia bacterium]|nr:putative Ig domain-containing protein [Blastocatellia bacterium]HNG34644.1 putative Ig domain-containing protein [Blastocatellia bacterium]